MNTIRWWLLIVAALVVGWFFGGRSPQPDNNEWRSEVDSLRAENDSLRAETARAWAYADTLRAQNDREAAALPTYPQLVEKRVKAMRYAPLEQAIDTLMMP